MTLENQSYKGGNVSSFFIVSKFCDISNCITIGIQDLITCKHVQDLIHSSNKLWVNLLSSKYLMEDQNLDATVILGASCVCKTIPMTTEVHKLGFMTGKGEVSLWYGKWLEINYLCNLVL